MGRYSLWVLEYSYVPDFPLSTIIYGAHNQGFRKLPYCYVLIKGQGRAAMVDVGYNNRDYGKVLQDRFGVVNWQPPEVVLAECGVRPEEVSDIFITHAHFDHLGNTDAFPKARYYIQERELSKWIWAMSLDQRYRWLMIATDPADILRTVDLARARRLVAVDGALPDVLPGIDLHPAHDTHTWGSMFVTVRNDGAAKSADAWVFAGDLIYSYENLRGPDASQPQYLPIGQATGSQTALIDAMDEMLGQVEGEVKRVIPIHDEALKDVFPSRVTDKGLRITEIALAEGERSRVV